jgi:protein tyrosine/serine phosphatase
VIDLRTPAEDKDGMERKEAAAQGLACLNLSLRMDQPGVAQNQQLLSQAIAAMKQFRQSNPHALIYVHCARGEDRMGLLVAAYRHLVEGVPGAAVEREMNQHYFNWHYPSLADTWRQIKSP